MLWVTIYVGVMCLAISACVGLKQILLGPYAPNYPSARPGTRLAMFVLSAFMLMRGSDLLLSVANGQAQLLAPISVLPSTGLAAYFAVQLAEILHQRLPASMWRRVDRAVQIATCVSVWDRLGAYLTGRETFEEARLRNAGGRPTMPAREAAHLMGEAVLRGEDFAGPHELMPQGRRLH